MKKSGIVIGAAGLCAMAGFAVGSDYTAGTGLCPLQEGPDVTLCEVYGIAQYRRDNVNDISSSALGNLGADIRWRLEFE